jgi:hypothetical protein
MNWLAETSRSPRFFRAIQKRPLAMVWLLPDTPPNGKTPAPPGRRDDFGHRQVFFTMSP